MYLYVKDSFESKYRLIINRRQEVGIKHEKNKNTFIDYSQTVADVYENLEGCNPTNKTKLFMVFNDFIADTEANKKLKLIVAELFTIPRKLNISLVFISCYFKVPKI